MPHQVFNVPLLGSSGAGDRPSIRVFGVRGVLKVGVRVQGLKSRGLSLRDVAGSKFFPCRC